MVLTRCSPGNPTGSISPSLEGNRFGIFNSGILNNPMYQLNASDYIVSSEYEYT